MTKRRLPIFIATTLLCIPAVSLAHENHAYKIGNESYQFTVGSMNEPIAVDDKTGVYLKVVEIGASAGAEAGHDEAAPGAVEGLGETLKVEVSAGGKKKEIALSPIHGEPGGYRATFIPTVQTTYTYRFFGTVNGVNVDLPFTCNPAGHPVAEEDKTEVKVSDGVTRLIKRGAFGCPVAKADIGFPEPAMSEYDIAEQSNTAVAGVSNEAKDARAKGMLGFGVGTLALILSIVGLVRGRKA